MPVIGHSASRPIQRVAITPDFADSLATHHDPRFLQPLAHQIDPSVGGLVDGLARPSHAHPTADSSFEFAVASKPSRRTAAAVPRPVSWPAAEDLPPVRWE
ncbi:MAG: hypothetical protein L0H24_08335, partial [Microlunatus sp.]|nr:hypothetical protein [Microlunatus sp.]